MARRGRDVEDLPDSDASLLVEAAQSTRAAGRTIFTCSTTVNESTGSGLGLGRKGTQVRQWSVAQVVEAIEAEGWHLEHLDHTWVQTEHNASLGGAAMIRGVVKAHVFFRRVPAQSPQI